MTTIWQPIETCPKGNVLLYFPEKRTRPHDSPLAPMIVVGHPSSYPFRKPTHWMTLPNPPVISD